LDGRVVLGVLNSESNIERGGEEAEEMEPFEHY
jgi:hypothetical protein